MLSPSRLGHDGRGNAPRDSIVADHCQRWKRLMAAGDAALFESVAGDLLQELGYETTGAPVRAVGRWSRLMWLTEDRVKRSLSLLTSRNHRLNYALLRWGRIRTRLRAKGWLT